MVHGTKVHGIMYYGTAMPTVNCKWYVVWSGVWYGAAGNPYPLIFSSFIYQKVNE